MKVAPRFLLLICLLILVANVFSQKVFILKGLGEINLTAVDVIHFRDSFQYWDWETEKRLQPVDDCTYILSTQADCVGIFFDTKYGGNDLPQKRPTEYPQFFINHIQCYPSDTIIISGLTFSQYYNTRPKQTVYIEYSDSMKVVKKIVKTIRKKLSQRLTKTLPYPPIKVNGMSMKHCLRLIKTKPINISIAHGINPRFTYTIYQDGCAFRFILDLLKAH